MKGFIITIGIVLLGYSLWNLKKNEKFESKLVKIMYLTGIGCSVVATVMTILEYWFLWGGSLLGLLFMAYIVVGMPLFAIVRLFRK